MWSKSYADPLKVQIYIDDAESQLSADANRQKAALQVDGKTEWPERDSNQKLIYL